MLWDYFIQMVMYSLSPPSCVPHTHLWHSSSVVSRQSWVVSHKWRKQAKWNQEVCLWGCKVQHVIVSDSWEVSSEDQEHRRGIRSRPMKIWHVTEKASVRTTVNYEVSTNADRLREDYACDSALIQEVWLEDLRRNTCSNLKCKFLCWDPLLGDD
jgi:hypothetical protein